MVYCTKCGANNEEDAKFCVNCGATLYPERPKKQSEDTCFGERQGRPEECFGLPHGGTIAGVIFGFFIILLGLAIFLGQDIGRWIGPVTLIIIGLLVVAGAIYGLSRRK